MKCGILVRQVVGALTIDAAVVPYEITIQCGQEVIRVGDKNMRSFFDAYIISHYCTD